jgi:Sulfotransferase domain
VSDRAGPRERLGRAAPRPVRNAVRSAARVLGRATSGARTLPTFLVIGTQRGGTTTLYHYLVQHPQVLGAVADKEVHFFDLRYAAGLGAYRGAFPTTGAARRVARDRGTFAIGEATPYYLFHPAVPERVASDLPDVRLLAVLRDPVARAWSHYRHEVELGFEDLSFEDALDAEAARTAGAAELLAADPAATSFAHQHHTYVARGRYVEQLERWWRAFPRERLLLVRSEDLHRDPAPIFDAICTHLGIGAWQPAAWETYNATKPAGMARETDARLRALFVPWNARLASATGRAWAWDGASA